MNLSTPNRQAISTGMSIDTSATTSRFSPFSLSSFKVTSLSAVVLATALLTGCGGGGGSSADNSPVITLLGESVLGKGRNYVEYGATALTINGDALTVTDIVGAEDIDSTTVGATYEVTYQVSDTEGNSSEVIRTVEVVEPRPFIFTYQTSSPDEAFIPGIRAAEHDYDFSIDWGDGQIDENVMIDATTVITPHIYAEPGLYTVSINGEFPRFTSVGPYQENYMSVEQWGDIKWQFVVAFFQDARNLVSNATDTPDLRLVSNLTRFFQRATKFNGNVSQWEISTHITDLTAMFGSADEFNQDLSTWDVSAVTEFNGMFDGAGKFDQDLSAWDMTLSSNFISAFSHTTLSSINYDKLLNRLAALEMSDDLKFDGGETLPTDAAAEAVSSLKAQGWIFRNIN